MQIIRLACSVQTVIEDRESSQTVAAVNCYFMCQDGSMFKAQVAFAPYFYLHVQVRTFAGAGSSP